MPGEEGRGAVQDLGILLGIHNIGVVQGQLLRNTEDIGREYRWSLTGIGFLEFCLQHALAHSRVLAVHNPSCCRTSLQSQCLSRGGLHFL